MDGVKGSDYGPEKCLDCKYFDPNEGGANGKCHRFPPSVSITLVPSGIDMLTQTPKLKSVELNAYPTPAAEQWCGEWQDSK